ncbi:hypothetical protein AZE42_13904, partial [Rhizopogon vesiculosus]
MSSLLPPTLTKK